MLSKEISTLLSYSIKMQFISFDNAKKIKDNKFVLKLASKIEMSKEVVDDIIDIWEEVKAKTKLHSLEFDIFTDELASHLIGDMTWINDRFNEFKNYIDAMNWYEKLAEFTTYIKRSKIEKDIVITKPNFSELIVTINKIKPEKTPEQIKAAAKVKPRISILSVNQIGLKGTLTQPPRMSHRVILMPFENQRWFLQYSPYQYFDKHSILVDGQEMPMSIDKHSVEIMLDFLDKMPSYNISLNSDIPIVGGSILNHMHFQVGIKHFPIYDARLRELEENVFQVDWYIKTLAIISNERDTVINLVWQLINSWKKFIHKGSSEIFNELHNSVSLTSRKVDGKYRVYILFRNNATSSQYPQGIFHVPEKYQTIKKENIGVIEACGLAILPGRLEYKNIKNTDDQAFIKWKNDIGGFENEDEYNKKLLITFQEILKCCNPITNDEVWNTYWKKVKEND